VPYLQVWKEKHPYPPLPLNTPQEFKLIQFIYDIFNTYTGNLHLNITTPDHSDEVLNEIEPYVFEWTGLAIFYLQFRLCFITY